MKNIYFIVDDNTKEILFSEWEYDVLSKLYDTTYTLDEQVFEYQIESFLVADDIVDKDKFIGSSAKNLVTAFKPIKMLMSNLFICHSKVLSKITAVSLHELNVDGLTKVDTISGLHLYSNEADHKRSMPFPDGCYVEDLPEVYFKVVLLSPDKHAVKHFKNTQKVELSEYQVNDFHFLVSHSDIDEVPDSIDVEEDKLTTAIKLLESYINCPKIADEVTRAQSFDVNDESHRKALIVNFCCSYDKVHRTQEFLNNNK